MTLFGHIKSIVKTGALAAVASISLASFTQAEESITEAVSFYEQSEKLETNFGTRQVVKASPQTIWSILADNEKYPQWNPFTPEAKTTFELGTPIEFKVRLYRALPSFLYPQKETVVKFDVNQSMCWEWTFLSKGAFYTYRCISLSVNEQGDTVVENAMHYEGLMNELVLLFTKTSVNDGFEDLSNAIKERAEAFEVE